MLSIGNLCAQHIEFMGIQLGQPRDVVNHLLVRKGYTYIGGSDTFDLFNGRFWELRNVSLNAYHDFGKVTYIKITPIDDCTWSKYNKLLASLKKKYGKPVRSSGGYVKSTLWKVKDGHIEVIAIGTDDNLITFSISYIDRTSISKAIGNKSKTIDDDL